MLSGRMEWSLDTSEKAFDGLNEAEFLAKSIKDVADHYGGNFLDQKTLDWTNLIQCLLIIYGGRIFTIRATPKPKPQHRPTVQETARVHNPSPPPVFTRPPANEFATTMNGHDASPPPQRAHIAGVGDVDLSGLPDGHPFKVN